MMALGSSGGIGGPSSSSSSLSASAPPFTIDQFSSNPNSNPVMHYGDAPYAPSFSHTWQYTPTPSAPLPTQAEAEAGSSRTSAMLVASEYNFLGPGSVNDSSTQWPSISPCDELSLGGFSVSEARPYHSPTMYPMVSGDSSSLTLSRPMYDQSSIHGASQGDYSEHLSGVDYAPHWQGAWNGELRNGNQIGSGGGSTTEKLNESSPFLYKNYINEGPTNRSGDASRGDRGIFSGLPTDGIQMESRAGSFHAGIPDGISLFSKNHDVDIYANPIDGTDKNKCSKSFNIMNMDGGSKSFNMSNIDGESLYSLNLGRLESPGTQFPGPISSFPEFSSPSIFQELSKRFINNQNTYGSQESCIQSRGLFGTDPKSPMKPDCTVVNQTPANKTSSCARDTDKIVGNKIASSCGSKLWDIPHLSEEKGYSLSTRPESIEGSCYTNKTDKECNSWNFFTSTSKGEVPINSHQEAPVEYVLSSRPTPQITDPKVSSGFFPSFDYVQSYKYTEDALENHILDSPCWKGSQVSYSSHNNIIESLPGIQSLKDLDGCLDIPGNPLGPSRVSSQDPSLGNANFRTGCAAKDELPAQTSISGSSCSAKEINPDAAATEIASCPYPGSSKDDQLLNDLDNHKLELSLSNIFMGNQTKNSCSNQCNMKKGLPPVEVNLHASIQDGVTSCNEAADAGSVAYHAAENVLYSPPAQEVYDEHHHPSVKVATQIVDISALVKAMHSISEVLHSHCLADPCGLTEGNQESVKHIIRNLDACLPKKIVNSSSVSEYMVPQESASISTGNGCDLGKAQGANQPHHNYQATIVSPHELGHQNIHSEKVNYCDYGSQARCLPYFLTPELDKRMSNDDKMVQAIKKVLDENFNFEEEMQSQVLLFKNLWLEAEARLCSISYRAHFDHMRILMDGYKLKKGKGSADDADKVPISKDSSLVKDTSLTAFFTENEALLKGRITNQSSSGIDTTPNNVDTSLFPRFNALSLHRDRFSPDEQKQPGIPLGTEGRFGSIIIPEAVGHVEDFRDEVLARLAILKQRDDKFNEVQQLSNVLDTNNLGRQSESSSGTSNPEIQDNHAESTFLARLNILKHRDDKLNEVQDQPNVHDANNSDAAALARYNILKQREIRSSAGESQNVDTRKAEGQSDSSKFDYGYESLKDFSEGAMNDQVLQPGRNINQENSTGSHDSYSSEWEHI